MELRNEMIIDRAAEHGPCSVRHLFYQAVVTSVPGITKNDSGYNKVQRAVLDLRRAGRIPYAQIVDSTRWMRKSDTFTSIEDALEQTARLYRRDLWEHSEHLIEVWCESDSIASTIVDIVDGWTLATMVTRGFSSDTFAYNAAEAWRSQPDRTPVVLYVGDHDPHGLAIERVLRERLTEFYDSDRIVWDRLGVTWAQVQQYDLPGTKPKRPYGYDLAVEAEALAPKVLRSLVDAVIRSLADPEHLHQLELVEAAERETLANIPGMLR